MLLDVLPTEDLARRSRSIRWIDFIEHINQLPGASSDSFLINRVVRGIEHFRVRKSAAETVTMMESQSAIDANNVAGSYTILKVFIWSLPILGFIGTVMGVSAAVASLASSLSDGGSMEAMKSALQDVFGGLGTAFDTTLLASDHEHAGEDSRLGAAKERGGLDHQCRRILQREPAATTERRTRRWCPASEPGGADTHVFREAVEQALGTQHAEMERWLGKARCHRRSADRPGLQGLGPGQQSHRTTATETRRRCCTNNNSTNRLGCRHNLTRWPTRPTRSKPRSIGWPNRPRRCRDRSTRRSRKPTTSSNQHLSGVEKGLASLGGVLQKLGDGQVVVQQVAAEPARKRGWFGRSSRSVTRKRETLIMPRRPRPNDDDISLFPFLSIIACVIGVLTMMIATLALAQTDTPDVALIEKFEQTQKELAQAEERIEELKREIAVSNSAALELQDQKKQLNMTVEELQSLLEELEQVERELAEQQKVEIVIPPIDAKARETAGGYAGRIRLAQGSNRPARKRTFRSAGTVPGERDRASAGKRVELHTAFRRVCLGGGRAAQPPDAKTDASGRRGQGLRTSSRCSSWSPTAKTTRSSFSSAAMDWVPTALVRNFVMIERSETARSLSSAWDASI